MGYFPCNVNILPWLFDFSYDFLSGFTIDFARFATYLPWLSQPKPLLIPKFLPFPAANDFPGPWPSRRNATSSCWMASRLRVSSMDHPFKLEGCLLNIYIYILPWKMMVHGHFYHLDIRNYVHRHIVYIHITHVHLHIHVHIQLSHIIYVYTYTFAYQK